MFISVDGKSQEVTDIFAGGKDGKAHRITEMFGSVDGIAKLVYSIEEEEPNGFDQFTWAEIKQLANEGKLLEHFKQFDRVTIKLKEPLRRDVQFYIKNYGIYETVPQVQNEMMFQIAEVTETSMRLMSPRVCALGTASSYVPNNTNNASAGEGTKFYYFTSDYKNNKGYARNYVGDAWGMTDMYDALKTIQNALPDDLLEVLSICERPMISYGKHTITGNTVMKFDEDMRVRQLTDNILSKDIDTSNDEIFYPIIKRSYFPTSVTEYMYYIRMPEKYDTYEQRLYSAKSHYSGYSLLDHSKKIHSDGAYIMQSYCQAPYATWGFTKGITNNDDYTKYNSIGSTVNTYGGGSYFTIFPEILIEADE